MNGRDPGDVRVEGGGVEHILQISDRERVVVHRVPRRDWAEGIVADILPPPNQKRRVTWGELERES